MSAMPMLTRLRCMAAGTHPSHAHTRVVTPPIAAGQAEQVMRHLPQRHSAWQARQGMGTSHPTTKLCMGSSHCMGRHD